MVAPKRRREIYLDPATAVALAEYAGRHRDRFRSESQAAAHLVRRGLASELDEGLEGVLGDLIERAVERAAGRALEDRLGALLRAQTDRLTGLLVKSGKDALTAAALAEAVLARLVGDAGAARQVAADARLRAGPAYSRPGLAGAAAED